MAHFVFISWSWMQLRTRERPSPTSENAAQAWPTKKSLAKFVGNRPTFARNKRRRETNARYDLSTPTQSQALVGRADANAGGCRKLNRLLGGSHVNANSNRYCGAGPGGDRGTGRQRSENDRVAGCAAAGASQGRSRAPERLRLGPRLLGLGRPPPRVAYGLLGARTPWLSL